MVQVIDCESERKLCLKRSSKAAESMNNYSILFTYGLTMMKLRKLAARQSWQPHLMTGLLSTSIREITSTLKYKFSSHSWIHTFIIISSTHKANPRYNSNLPLTHTWI